MKSYTRRLALVGGVVALAAASLAPAGIAKAQQLLADTSTPRAANDDGLTVMREDGRFSEWIQLLGVSGLARTAELTHPYTMFVPTDDAMGPFALDYTEMLGVNHVNVNSTPDLPRINRVVRSHTLEGIHPLTEFKGKKVTLQSTFNTQVDVDGTQSGVLIVTVHRPGVTAVQRISTQPLMANNAIIYPVEAVSVTR